MLRLEELTEGSRVAGLEPSHVVVLRTVSHAGEADTASCSVIFERADGSVDRAVIYRWMEPELTLRSDETLWSFSGDPELFALALEAQRIRLAHLFDPLQAVHAAAIQPLPHQLAAVYEEMLPRQPLRYLLADDPGAGKTIMAGLLMRELMLRDDVRRCLVVCPGSLAEQWQDELHEKFGLDFSIVSNQSVKDSRTGNPFIERDQIIVRLDHAARNEDIQARLAETEWDLVVFDEAHKLSATYENDGTLDPTARYRLGELLTDPERTRHALLMTATPHNGKEENFQAFLRLLDRDRFEGRPRKNAARPDLTDLMRRLSKEQIVTFESTPLFPQRKAYTASYELSPAEMQLYEAVSDYVREGMHRAEKIAAAKHDRRRIQTVGFALTVLQRRLASSPAAIHHSLRRRRERLEQRIALMDEAERRGITLEELAEERPEIRKVLTRADIDDMDDRPADEQQAAEEQALDSAFISLDVSDLRVERDEVAALEQKAEQVKRSGNDAKWNRLADVLHDPVMREADGRRRKLIIFTEHRDTLNYLVTRLKTALGNPDGSKIVTIVGGMHRDSRREVQERFWRDSDVEILVATDAAGEGFNLHCANLLINYDLPWNPNRLEQRFGRIHRIGQHEVCHMWSLVATGTREGDVYERLLTKLEVERHALNGQVFDVLGQLFEEEPLRDLLMRAVREGSSSEAKAYLRKKIDSIVDLDRARRVASDNALVPTNLDSDHVAALREEMDRAAARRIQPHYIERFFQNAMRLLGGTIHPRERGRLEITRVPPAMRRTHPATALTRDPVIGRYDRVCFEPAAVEQQGRPDAALLVLGHPLLESAIDAILERAGDVLTQGAILVDPDPDGRADTRTLFMLRHTIRDGTGRTIHEAPIFVEVAEDGTITPAGFAPHINYRPATSDERTTLASQPVPGWATSAVADRVAQHASSDIAPTAITEQRALLHTRIDRVHQQVRARLTDAIAYNDRRAQQLLDKKTPDTLNARKARDRAEQLQHRLAIREAELNQQRAIRPIPPTVIAGALVVPAASLTAADVVTGPTRTVDPEARRQVELIAMGAVMETERALGNAPRDVSAENVGYDIESADGVTGRLRFIEVKGRNADEKDITVTANELHVGLNVPEQFILAVVLVDGGTVDGPHYVPHPFTGLANVAQSATNFNIAKLLEQAVPPSAVFQGPMQQEPAHA